MDLQQIIDSLDALSLDELLQLQARVSELIAQMKTQPAPTEGTASYEAYRQMKAEAPEDLGQK
jgi:hypothetical protein